MKLDTWELESAARDRDAGKIIEIFARHFPELLGASAEWSFEVDDTKTIPHIVITVVTPSIAVTYAKSSFRIMPPSVAKYMRITDAPYIIILDGV